jgi:hypothetical protein
VSEKIGSFEEREDMQACLTVSRRLVLNLPFVKAGRFFWTTVEGNTP